MSTAVPVASGSHSSTSESSGPKQGVQQSLIGMVRLAVSDLARSIAFYQQVVGLAVLGRVELGEGAALAQLGVGEVALLELEQRPGVMPVGDRSEKGARLGLYHTAFLLPTREDLGSFVRHLGELRIAFAAGDHTVSEAIYLVDPDGLEVEVYADRPRSAWRWDGPQLLMGTAPVQLKALAGLAQNAWSGAPAGTRLGHLHFFVDNLEMARRFYVDGLGFDTTIQIPSAIFVSYGGYHHHIGLNVWRAGSPVASSGDARLMEWELRLPSGGALEDTIRKMLQLGFQAGSRGDGAATFTDSNRISVALLASEQS